MPGLCRPASAAWPLQPSVSSLGFPASMSPPQMRRTRVRRSHQEARESEEGGSSEKGPGRRERSGARCRGVGVIVCVRLHSKIREQPGTTRLLVLYLPYHPLQSNEGEDPRSVFLANAEKPLGVQSTIKERSEEFGDQVVWQLAGH